MTGTAEKVDCCVVGGGPAGMVLGLLLARKGVRVTVLEMHHDFDRDFRGDTVHASTMEVLDQIGLADGLLELPHTKMRELSFNAAGRRVPLIDLTHLKTRFPYITMMPQALFLEYLRDHAAQFPNFRCETGAAVRGLLDEGGITEGVRYLRDGEEHTLPADLVVACDGRFSRIRKLAGVAATTQTAPMDIAWFRVPRAAGDGDDSAGFYLGAGQILVLLARPDSWQAGYVFPKGDFATSKPRAWDTSTHVCRSLLPGSPTASRRSTTGPTSTCCPSPLTGCPSGIGPACCSSATQRT